MYHSLKAKLSKLLSDKTSQEITGTDFAGNKRGLNVADLDRPLSAFGESFSVQPTPTMQIDALHGVQTDAVETFTGVSGTATVKDDHGGKEFTCSSGTSVGGYGILRSRNVLRYRPGQGARLRFTARFGTPVAGSLMRAGGVNLGTELSFGYNGTQFGLLYRTGGRPEIQKLTLTAAATGNETVTLTLNGTAYSISVTTGTAAHNAYEIAASTTFTGAWSAQQNGDTVTFQALDVGDKAGTMSVSSTGTMVGSLAETAAGRAVSDTFVNQADWNVTSLTTSDDLFILDPSKGNVFEITYQYLGYGDIEYHIEDPTSGRFILVHRLQYANNNTVPSLDTPNLKIGWFAASAGSTTNVEIFGASGAGFVDGKIVNLKNPVGHFNTKTGVGTTLTNILSIRVRNTFNGYVNIDEVFPDFFSVASEGTKTAICELFLNPTLGGEPNWSFHDETNSIVEVDTAATTVSGSGEIISLVLGKADSAAIPIKNLNIKLVRGDILTIAARASSGTTEISGALTWNED